MLRAVRVDEAVLAPSKPFVWDLVEWWLEAAW
jgi:hypothetical protein